MYEKKEKWREAAQIWSQLPQWQKAALAWLRIGKIEKACICYENCYQWEKSEECWRKLNNWERIGNACENQGKHKWQEAAEAYQKGGKFFKSAGLWRKLGYTRKAIWVASQTRIF